MPSSGPAILTRMAVSLNNNKGGELLVKMRRDAGFKMGGFPVVAAFDDLRDGVKACDDGRGFMRNVQLHKFATGPQEAAPFCQQLSSALPRLGGNSHSAGESFQILFEQP